MRTYIFLNKNARQIFHLTSQNLSFRRNAYLNGRKRQNPPGIEVLNFLFFRFILDYKYQKNLFQNKISYIEALRETESEFRFVYFFFIHPVYQWRKKKVIIVAGGTTQHHEARGLYILYNPAPTFLLLGGETCPHAPRPGSCVTIYQGVYLMYDHRLG